MNHASLKDYQLKSPLMEALLLKPRKKSGKRNMVAGLILTSLVDAFSIMLLYLLCQPTGNGSTLELAKAENLPTAVKTAALNNGTIVKVEGHHYYLNNVEIQPVQLAQQLQLIKANFGSRTDDDSRSLIIQADKSVDFSDLTPIVRAGSVSGFNKFKFAVLAQEG